MYKLLTFNQDWADEHSVPALACMTEEEYLTWLETPSGKINPNYEKQLAIYNDKLEQYNNFYKEFSERYDAGERFGPKDSGHKWYLENHKSFPYGKPSKVRSGLYAALGNSGDGFEERFSDLYLMKEFVETGIVKVFDVSEDFYNTFKQVDLSSLSLCNVFRIELDDDYFDDNDDDDD